MLITGILSVLYMTWYKKSKTNLTTLDLNKFKYIIFEAAANYFVRIMEQAGGDPLPSANAVIENIRFYGPKMGLTEDNITELAEQLVQNHGLGYITGGTITISWEKLPQQYKQRARQRSGAFK